MVPDPAKALSESVLRQRNRCAQPAARRLFYIPVDSDRGSGFLGSGRDLPGARVALPDGTAQRLRETGSPDLNIGD